MCGRYTLRARAEAIADEFELPVLPPYVPRWNISPTQMIPTIRLEDDKPAMVNLRWGFNSVLGRRPQKAAPAHQCEIGDGGDEAVIPLCLQAAPLPGARRWLLRVAEGRQAQAALVLPIQR